MVATRGYAHARIAVLERPKRDATRRTPPPPWRVRAGKRSRHHGRSSGVAALPTVPSRESYSFSVVGHLSLTRSPHTLANDRLSLAIQLLYVRVACRGVGRARARVAVRPTEGNGSEREARGRGRGVAPWEPRKTFPAYHPSAAPLPPPPPREENTSTHGLRTRPNTRESVRSGTAAKEVWSRDGPRDRPVTSQRTILSLPPFFSFSVLPRYLSLRATHLPSRSIPPSLSSYHPYSNDAVARIYLPREQLRRRLLRFLVRAERARLREPQPSRNLRPRMSSLLRILLSSLSLSLHFSSFSFVEKTRSDRTRRMMIGKGNTLTGNDRSQQWMDSSSIRLT